jgi:predicted Zn finger-like uncharacterized protein
MPLEVKCPACQAVCGVAETAAGRKVRCPRCQNVFPSAPSPRGNDLIPPRKPRGKELIPPPADGASVKETPSFAAREVQGLAVVLLVGGITGVVMLGVIAVIAGYSLFKATRPGPQPAMTGGLGRVASRSGPSVPSTAWSRRAASGTAPSAPTASCWRPPATGSCACGT